jgi:hypothetical protein
LRYQDVINTEDETSLLVLFPLIINPIKNNGGERRQKKVSGWDPNNESNDSLSLIAFIPFLSFKL